MTRANSNYHHGDLRNALILAAADLIEESGTGGFTMIDAARRAGVSSGAPYRHFADKDALLDEVCRLAFVRLSDEAKLTAQQFKLGSPERIVSAGKTYVEFVIGHPAYYDLMWGAHGFRGGPDEEELKTSAFYVLVDSVQAWCSQRGIADKDPVDLAVKLWAIAHGLAGLTLHKHIAKFSPDADVYSLLETSTYTFLDGLCPPSN